MRMWLRKRIAGDKIGHDYHLYSDDAHLKCNKTIHSRPEAGYSRVMMMMMTMMTMMMTKTSFIRATNWRRLDFPTLDFPWALTIPNQREDGQDEKEDDDDGDECP